MIDWKSHVNVSQKSRKNIEEFITSFDKFIMQQHKTDFSYDQKIKRQWQAFKSILQANPIDLEGHNKYVTMLKGKSGLGGTVDSSAHNDLRSRKLMHLESIAPILMQINRTKLEDVAKKAVRVINKNTKTIVQGI